jgi:ABC-type multidrug transport system fused ATPase/permease subunit
MQLVTESLVVLGLSVLLLLVEPVGALIVVSVIGAAAWLFHRLTRNHIERWGKERLFHDGFRFQHLQQGLSAVKDVKLLGREEEFLAQYRRHNKLSARAARLQSTIQQLPRLWLEVLAVAGLAALVLVMLGQGRDIGTILPTLAVFGAAAFRLMPTVNRMISSVQSLRYGLSVIDTLYEEFKLYVPVPSSVVREKLSFEDALEVENVWFKYSGASEPSIQNLSVMIRKGESIGFIGPSGAGKSTLIDLLLGLLEPDSGEIKLDGTNILNALRSWQDQIGYVPQSMFLTDDSLRRNVAFGLAEEQIDEAAVWRALRAAQLDGFVQTLPDGLDTVVGERGVRLSGGQRQRIGIARALYHDPSVLVLDEATSSLDTMTENSVMQAVRSLKGSKTIIIVAHRLSTVEYCDRLYRLESGKVVEQGKPGEMLFQAATA